MPWSSFIFIIIRHLPFYLFYPGCSFYSLFPSHSPVHLSLSRPYNKRERLFNFLCDTNRLQIASILTQNNHFSITPFMNTGLYELSIFPSPTMFLINHFDFLKTKTQVESRKYIRKLSIIFSNTATLLLDQTSSPPKKLIDFYFHIQYG